MQQRQLRLGDILDDYCPRERRLTNHAVVAMVGPDVKQTRCTTCDTEHEYKHAKVPRQRKKSESPAVLYSQVLSGGPKRHEHAAPVDATVGSNGSEPIPAPPAVVSREADTIEPEPRSLAALGGEPIEGGDDDDDTDDRDASREEGPVHRPLIRASLPRPEGHPPPTRPNPEFTIRQPGGRQNRFRPRNGRGPQMMHGNRPNGPMSGGPPRGGMSRPSGMPHHAAKRHGPGRKRSK